MDIIKCSYCGKDLPKESNFCPYCMERINEPLVVKLPENKKAYKEKSIIIIIFSVVLVLLLLIGTVFFAHYKNNENNNVDVSNDITENANTPDNTSGLEEFVTNDVSTSNGDKTTQEKTTEKSIDNKEENINSTSITTTTTTTTNKVVQECSHNWVPATETVYHDEVGHYEDVQKQRKITKYKCPVCYNQFDSTKDYYDHFDSTHTPSYDGDPVKALRNQYTTVNDYEYYTVKEWIVDKEAYSEIVTMGYKCDICGKEK